MKNFILDLKEVVEVHFSNPALFWAGFSLSSVFMVVGLIVSIEVWLPIAAVIATAVLIAMAYKEYRDILSPEREQLIRQAVSYIVSMSIRGRMPYRVDLPTKEVLAKRMKISKKDGVEIVTVPLLILDKEDIDLRLLDKVFSDHFEMTVGMTPGLGLKAYEDSYNVLTLIDLKKLDMEVILHIVIADNRYAVQFLNNWFEEPKQDKKGGRHNG